MAWLAVVAITTLYAAAVEYAIHRWAMHCPFPWRTKLYTDHHVEHHGKGRNDLNIAIDPFTVLFLGSPLLWVLPSLIGWVGASLWLAAASTLYAAVWTVLHASFHGVGFRWAPFLPGYYVLYDHHMAHHTNPGRNFGTVFFWSDYLMGTKV